jgi:ELWxxDGT repeat protein
MNHRVRIVPGRHHSRDLSRRCRARFESLEQRLVFNATSAPSDLTADGSTLYFTANDGIHGSQVWTSGGSSITTAMLTDINPGSVGGQPENLTVVGSQVFFTANDGTNGRELWVTTGPGAFNTFLVRAVAARTPRT